MPATAASDQAPTVEPPKHSLSELTTYELKDYRRQLERAVAYFDTMNPAPPARADLQARLDEVLAEHDSRARIVRA